MTYNLSVEKLAPLRKIMAASSFPIPAALETVYYLVQAQNHVQFKRWTELKAFIAVSARSVACIDRDRQHLLNVSVAERCFGVLLSAVLGKQKGKDLELIESAASFIAMLREMAPEDFAGTLDGFTDEDLKLVQGLLSFQVLDSEFDPMECLERFDRCADASSGVPFQLRSLPSFDIIRRYIDEAVDLKKQGAGQASRMGKIMRLLEKQPIKTDALSDTECGELRSTMLKFVQTLGDAPVDREKGLLRKAMALVREL